MNNKDFSSILNTKLTKSLELKYTKLVCKNKISLNRHTYLDLINLLWKNNIIICLGRESYIDGDNWILQLNTISNTLNTKKGIFDGSCIYGDNHEFPTFKSAFNFGCKLGLKLLSTLNKIKL